MIPLADFFFFVCFLRAQGEDNDEKKDEGVVFFKYFVKSVDRCASCADQLFNKNKLKFGTVPLSLKFAVIVLVSFLFRRYLFPPQLAT